MVIFLQIHNTDWTTCPVICFCFSGWPISIHNRVYVFHRFLSDNYFDVLYSGEYVVKCFPFSKPFSSYIALHKNLIECGKTFNKDYLN